MDGAWSWGVLLEAIKGYLQENTPTSDVVQMTVRDYHLPSWTVNALVASLIGVFNAANSPNNLKSEK